MFKEGCEGSIRAVLGEDSRERHPDDADVEGNRPVTDVVKIVGNAHFHFVDEIGFPPPTVDLRLTIDARLDLVPQKISVDQFAVLLVVLEKLVAAVRQRTCAPRHDVQQLRELVGSTATERAQR